MTRRVRIPVVLVAVLLVGAGTAFGFIERLFSLREMLDASTHVLVGRIESVDAAKGTAVAGIDRALKGNKDFARIRMNLGVAGAEHVRYLLPRLKSGQPFIILYQREGKNLASCAHAGDTWFQLFGTDDAANRDRVWWRMSHIEIYLGRTYNGNTPGLITLVDGVLAGRVESPRPDPTVPKLDLSGKPAVVRRPAEPEKPAPTPPPPATPIPAPPGTSALPADGFESLRGWVVDDDWSRRGTLTLRDDAARGKVLEIASEGDPARKLALFILHHLDVSTTSRMTLDVAHSATKPVRVSVAFGAAPDWRMHETPPADVPPGAAPRTVLFRLDRPHFKCETSGWQHTATLPNAGRVDKMMILVEGLPAKGSVRFDRLRFGTGGLTRSTDFPHKGGEARGIAWADVNGDDRLDTVVCVQHGNLLLVNQGGGAFREQSKDFGLMNGSRAASWADYDADGHPDLLTNDFRVFTHAGGRLRDDAKLLPRPRHYNPEGAGWIDFNGDGRPDVLITNGEDGIRLYENTGKGPEWFRDVSDRAGLGPKGLGVGNGDFIALADLDGDGCTDLFYNLGTGVLARADGEGRFIADARAKITLPGTSAVKRGVAFADFDRDGDVDGFVPAPDRPRLCRNNNDGTFTDVLDASGDLARDDGPSFAAAWGDVNNDGHLDLFVCRPTGASRLYLADGGGRFTDATETVRPGGFGACFAASFADVDDDGDLDLLLNRADRATLILNELDLAEDACALAVDVRATRGATGAVVRVVDPDGRPLGYHELTGADGPGGQPRPVAHFGVRRGARLTVTVALSDGRAAGRTLTPTDRLTRIVFRDRDFN